MRLPHTNTHAATLNRIENTHTSTTIITTIIIIIISILFNWMLCVHCALCVYYFIFAARLSAAAAVVICHLWLDFSKRVAVVALIHMCRWLSECVRLCACECIWPICAFFLHHLVLLRICDVVFFYSFTFNRLLRYFLEYLNGKQVKKKKTRQPNEHTHTAPAGAGKNWNEMK